MSTCSPSHASSSLVLGTSGSRCGTKLPGRGGGEVGDGRKSAGLQRELPKGVYNPPWSHHMVATVGERCYGLRYTALHCIQSITITISIAGAGAPALLPTEPGLWHWLVAGIDRSLPGSELCPCREGCTVLTRGRRAVGACCTDAAGDRSLFARAAAG